MTDTYYGYGIGEYMITVNVEATVDLRLNGTCDVYPYEASCSLQSLTSGVLAAFGDWLGSCRRVCTSS
jgi:hypothetical protein